MNFVSFLLFKLSLFRMFFVIISISKSLKKNVRWTKSEGALWSIFFVHSCSKCIKRNFKKRHGCVGIYKFKKHDSKTKIIVWQKSKNTKLKLWNCKVSFESSERWKIKMAITQERIVLKKANKVIFQHNQLVQESKSERKWSLSEP